MTDENFDPGFDADLTCTDNHWQELQQFFKVLKKISSRKNIKLNAFLQIPNQQLIIRLPYMPRSKGQKLKTVGSIHDYTLSCMIFFLV